jgi:RNA polymerase sigma factor (sigma-70 family)
VTNRLEIFCGTADDLIPTRKTLLSRLKNWSDQESWNDFFNTYWRLIYSIALKAGLTKEEAEDVVQETVISVCKSMPQFRYNREAGSFKGWLLKLTRWRIRDQFRRRLPDAVFHEDVSETEIWSESAIEVAEPSGAGLEEVWDQEWERNLLNAALEEVKRQVNPQDFQMFDLNVLQKVPATKVGTLLNVNAGRVHLAKHRISALLRKAMGRLEKSYF